VITAPQELHHRLVASNGTPGRCAGHDGGGRSTGKPKTAEMHPGPGFRIQEAIARPAPETWEPLREFETPAISDQMNRLYTMTADIHVLTDPSHQLVGPACTVKCYPGDNLMVHKALDVARPGDVVCVDATASGTTAVLGDLVSTKARHRGIAGFIVDGLIRDLPGIQQLGAFRCSLAG
jgi:hypothetical protein